MLNWRIIWSALSSRLSPALYRRWRFSEFRTLKWSDIQTIKDQEPELLLLPEFLAHPGYFLDVGANNGVYLYAALAKKNAQEMVGVEPIPRLSNLLKRAFPLVHIHNLALTDSNGPRWLKIPDIGGRTLPTRATLNVNFEGPGETGRSLIQVATMTLDGFWKSIGDHPLCCIKIDTEGHEYEVLKGAAETLARHRPVLLVEIEQRHHVGKIDTVFQLLADMNYTCFYFDPSVPALHKISGSQEEVQKAQGVNARYLNNFFFLPSEGRAFFDLLDGINQRLALGVTKT